MVGAEELVSIGVPVFNGADRLERAVRSVLAQDHENLEVVISDNGSTDGTQELCRELARSDSRIVYHRHPENIGLLNNFVAVMRMARGGLFRWLGDDDELAPDCLSRCVRQFAEDDRLLVVTTRIAYSNGGDLFADGDYRGAALRSPDPVERFREMLRLLNESDLVIDPLYGVMKRDRVAAIPRRNIMREDEVFATKLALAGPWAHVPEVLARRNRPPTRLRAIARRLDVPSWRTYFSTSLQCMEIIDFIAESDLTDTQRRAAVAAVTRMFLRRHKVTAQRRGRRLVRKAAELVGAAHVAVR